MPTLTTQVEIHPQLISPDDPNQLKPVLALSILMKMAKIPTLNTNSTHFYLKFLFTESLDAQDHYGTSDFRINLV